LQSVRIWSIAKGECIHELYEHSHVVECVAFSPPVDIQIGEEPSKVSSSMSLRVVCIMSVFVSMHARVCVSLSLSPPV